MEMLHKQTNHSPSIVAMDGKSVQKSVLAINRKVCMWRCQIPVPLLCSKASSGWFRIQQRQKLSLANKIYQPTHSIWIHHQASPLDINDDHDEGRVWRSDLTPNEVKLTRSQVAKLASYGERETKRKHENGISSHQDKVPPLSNVQLNYCTTFVLGAFLWTTSACSEQWKATMDGVEKREGGSIVQCFCVLCS